MAKQNRQTDLQNLPPCAADFIKQVIKRMRYRKKVGREVQAELTAHFQDELKDCANDQDKEQKAQQLIAGFGDAKLLAVLLRRAKKRCRPLWRTIVARAFQTASVLILCFVLYAVWFLSGKPSITTNYVSELNRIVRPAADEALNAAPLYNKAAKLYEKLPDDISKLLRKKYAEAAPEEKQLIEKWLTDNRETLELVIVGSQKPHYWQKHEGDEMISVRIPNLRGFKELARSLCWRAQLRAEQGRYEDAFGDIKSSYRLGQRLRGNKSIIEQLVGISIEALAVQTLRAILSGHEIDSSTLATLQQDFEGIISDEDFTISLKAERLCMYDEIQRCFTSDRIGKGHLYLPRFRQISDLAASYQDREGFEYLILDLVYSAPFLFGHPNKEETLDSANELYDYWDKLCLKSAAQIHADSNAIDSKFEKLVGGNIFLNVLAPALKRVIEISNRVHTEAGATLTIIAILRYKQDTGRYPQNLNQLTAAAYLRQLPIDSFADKPLVYKKTENNFILYSVGSNFTDDGGEPSTDRTGRVKNWHDNGDTVFWPLP